MKKLLLILTIIASCLFISGGSGVKAYDPLKAACSPTSTAAVCQQNAEQQTATGNPNPIAGPTGVIQKVTNLIAAITAIIAIVMIVISGLNFITSGGGDNPAKTKKARARIAAALIGLLVIALSWTIVTFVVRKFIK